MLIPFSRLRSTLGRDNLLVSTSAIHLVNDACFSLLYPLLPFISEDLGLSFTEVGLLKATFSGSAGILQIPAAAIGVRFGEQLVLLLGNLWVGLGLVVMGFAGGFLSLLLLATLAGIGGNAQHPLGASIISKRSEGPRLATAMGTLNFSGDLGKLVGPFVAGLVAVTYGWRAALAVVGVATAVLSILILIKGRERAPDLVADDVTGVRHASLARDSNFRTVLAAGGLDNATRGAALTFLPFVLADKGLDAAAVSALFAVIFAAGAAGKFGCGWISDRWNLTAVIVITELVTAGSMLAMLWASVWMVIPLAVAFGFALNGTSSALNVAVARFVPSGKRSSGYGIYFTVALVSSAFAPLAYGVLGDASGLTTVFMVMSALTVAVIIVILPIRRQLARVV